LLDGSAWVLRPFLTILLPLVTSTQAGDHFDVISNLRSNCPLLQPERLPGPKMVDLLARLKSDVDTLVKMLSRGASVTVRDVLLFVRDRELISLDDRFLSFFDVAAQSAEDEDAAVDAFLACPAAELWGYQTYIEDQSPFATQQGIKGAEFERVMVVLDDEESAYNLFSYGKYFGFLALSDTDRDNIATGKDSVLDRTRRLFYVCCSRARLDLVVVLFVPDVAAALPVIVARGLFPPENIHTADNLAMNTV
jgi:DNA helicase-2/ATP-dependent DNA helicase PcrA